MIVPANRLLFAGAVVVLPIATVGSALPSAQLTALLLLLLLALVVAIDAVRAGQDLAGVVISLPEVIRLAKDRDDGFPVTIRNTSQQRRLIRFGLVLPESAMRAAAEEIEVTLPAGTDASTVYWACTATQRGRFPVQLCCLEAKSPLGFWLRRQRQPLASEIRVYPNVLNDRKHLAALFLRHQGIGIHAQRQVGKGRDFEELRDYIPGDSFDEIHWKATAKRQTPITKVFQLERTQEVYVVVDCSRLTRRRGSENETAEPIVERYVTAALVMALVTERLGDLFGLITFSSRVHRFIRARSGAAHFNACREVLCQLQAGTVSPDFGELATFVRLRLPRRALLIVLTCLDDPVLAESFAQSMDLLHRQHLVLVNVAAPAAVQPLFSTAAASPAEIYRHLGAHLRWDQLNDLHLLLQQRGIQMQTLDTGRLCPQLVSQYMNVKRRQIL